ncbi:hypothetical protein [Streptomyces scabiei]|uniref:Uncharacterized protein n=1 Tax=Streptomyces scabiei TaxID=1930 RepID=A0A124C3S9_STRSC|nr:hypothetical protein [Streptomyces scabiei]GAQ62258.1 hypothetical protein SsS58_02620 [Streptomyces scabiei]
MTNEPDIDRGPDPDALPRCGEPGPDSWTLLLQGGSFCSLPLGHPGRHYEPGAPRTWIADE